MQGTLRPLAFALLLSGCNPMYVAGPAPIAIFHQQKDITKFVNGGIHGVSGGAGIALSDHVALRVSGGYRPFSLGENGYGMGGVTGFLSLRRSEVGPDRNANGFRGALSIDVGGGGGLGNSRTFNLFGSSGTTLNTFSGNYVKGQVQLDVGYEWPIFLLLGTARVTVFNLRPITAAYIEPSVCFRVGPEYIRFEVQLGVSLPFTGNTDNLGGIQPFIASVGISGLLETASKPPAPALEPERVPPVPPPPELTAPPPTPPPPL